MMKFFYCVAAMPIILVALSSCEETKGTEDETVLETPVLTVVSQSDDAFVITWDAVSQSAYYVCKVNGEESATAQPRLEQTGLELGTYVVEVKAVAIPETGYTDSEWGTITVTLDLSSDWFGVEPFLKDDDVYNYYKYNSVYVRFTGYDVASIYAGVYTPDMLEGLDDSAIIELVTNTLSINDEGIREINSSGMIENGVNNLEPETEYIVAAYATHISGLDTLVICDPIMTEAVPDPPEGLEDWIGSYTVTSTHALQLTADGNTPVWELLDSTITFDITIEPSPNDVKTLYIYGWSILEDQLGTRLPCMAQISDDGRKGLRMVQGYVNYSSTTLYWMPICYRSDEQYAMMNIADGIFTLYNEGGNITATMYSGTSGGLDYDVEAYDLFMMNSANVQIPHQVPAYFPAGDFTLEKVDVSEQTQFLNSSRAEVYPIR